jgi:hypothetical protein
MVILSLLAYGVYKERQKLLSAQSEAGKEKPENNNTIAAAAVTAAATVVANAANAATAAANGATATAASTSTVKSKAGTVLCESDRRKRALQEWKAKHKAQLERRQQQDAETESERDSASKEDTEKGQAALKLAEKNSGEKVVPAAEKKVVPSAERGEAPQPAAKPVLGVTADKEELVAGAGRPKKMVARPPALTSSALEDSGPAAVFMPILQPPVAKTAIKFHLKSLAKAPTADAAATAKVAEKIELIDLSGEEDESGGDQLIKARNLLRSSQDRLGKNDLHILGQICGLGKNTIALIMVPNPTMQ